MLRVAAVDAKRVQLEDFAREIFVEPERATAAARELCGAGARTHRRGVVEVQVHRRMAFCREQQRVEVAEHVWANRLLLVQSANGAHELLVG